MLLRVHASSVNPVEWYGVTGPYFVRLFGGGLRKPKSTRVGADVAGVVEAVGKDVTEFKPGDEVFGTSGAAWAEYAPAREVRLVRKPANVSFEEAAAVPIAAITALQALRDKGGVQPGQKVLINGASGGVGTFAVQIAKALGADVTAVCSTGNVELARSLGADRVVDYTQEDFTRLSERHELMIDIAGSQPFRKFRRVLTPKATVVIVGAKFPSNRRDRTAGSHDRDESSPPWAGARRRSSSSRRSTRTTSSSWASGSRPGRSSRWSTGRFELSQAAEALSYLGEGHARGKVIITM